ncbi:MAG: ABC transporter permease [Bacteriovoracaceae bacterium]
MEHVLKNRIELLGRVVIDFTKEFGQFTNHLTKIVYWFFRRPYRYDLLFEQLYFIGNKSLFITCLTSSFSGMVMCFQTYHGFKVISGDTFVGPIVAISLARELAPVFTGLIVAGRAGSAMTAQIGSMKVTEQIDALEVMGINSYQYLALPRIIAGTLSLPLLSIIFLLIGNIGAWVIATKVLLIEEVVYFSKFSEFVFYEDILQGIIKAFFFGFVISSIGTYQGFQVAGGALGVGKSTNKSVVWSMVVILILDFFLTSILTKVL